MLHFMVILFKIYIYLGGATNGIRRHASGDFRTRPEMNCCQPQERMCQMCCPCYGDRSRLRPNRIYKPTK